MIHLATLALAALPAAPPVTPQTDRLAAPRPDVVLTVDASGQGDFVELRDAVDAAPEGALILVAPGTYASTTILAKSLRIHAESAGTAWINGPFAIRSIGDERSVHVDGLGFLSGFQIRQCDGEVDLTACAALRNGVLAPPPHSNFTLYPNCGEGLGLQTIEDSDAVTLVDCALEGRHGSTLCDGAPGQHGLVVLDSTVAIYGGSLEGGDGGDGDCGHHSYPGAGGDGFHASGAESLVHLCDVASTGGEGGRDPNGVIGDGCDGVAWRTYDGATVESCGAGRLRLEMQAAAAPATGPAYTIAGPPGASVFLLISRSRGFRHFESGAGVLHLDSSFQTVALGTIPAGGEITRPFPAPNPAWLNAFSNVEIQAYSVLAGVERYSNPRTLLTFYGQ